jgi:hypothetical protein
MMPEAQSGKAVVARPPAPVPPRPRRALPGHRRSRSRSVTCTATSLTWRPTRLVSSGRRAWAGAEAHCRRFQCGERCWSRVWRIRRRAGQHLVLQLLFLQQTAKVRVLYVTSRAQDLLACLGGKGRAACSKACHERRAIASVCACGSSGASCTLAAAPLASGQPMR